MSVGPYVSYDEYLNHPHLRVGYKDHADALSDVSSNTSEESEENFYDFPNFPAAPKTDSSVCFGIQLLIWIQRLWEGIKALLAACFSPPNDLPSPQTQVTQAGVGRFEHDSDYW